MFHLHSKFTWPCIVLSALTLASCGSDDDDDGPSLDTQLRSEIDLQGLTGDPGALRNLPSIDDPIPALGRVLFFTKGLGGDKDSACVSCHHPLLGGGGGLALSIDDYFADFDSNLALLEYNGYAIQTENAETNARKALAQLQDNREQRLGNVRPVDMDLSDEQIDDLIAFLEMLTDPRLDDADALSPWIASDANDDPNPGGLRVEAIGL